MGGTGYDKKSGNIRDGWRVTGRDFRFSGGIGAKTGRYLARARPRLPAEPVDARGSRCSPAARAEVAVQHAKQHNMQSIVPDLATGWSWSEDGTELTFPLREGVKWHDGKPFTAEDVKCTWDLLT